MLAAFYTRTGPARDVLNVGEIETPVVGPGEVRVKLACSGVNPSDVKSRGGVRSRDLPFPRIVPHSDGAGVIDAVGAGVSPQRVGRARVGVECRVGPSDGHRRAVRRAAGRAGGAVARRHGVRCRSVPRHSRPDRLARRALQRRRRRPHGTGRRWRRRRRPLCRAVRQARRCRAGHRHREFRREGRPRACRGRRCDDQLQDAKTSPSAAWT